MVLSMDRWKGKVAVVTGASSGIGAALVEALVKQGLKVVGLARRVERVQELSEKLKNEPGKLYPVKCDVQVKDDIINAFKWTTENVGLVHILINNAGVYVPAMILDKPYDLLKRTVEVNILGLTIATAEAINIMKDNNIAGHIIQINSLCGHKHIHVPYLNIYPPSKHAVTALNDIFTNELIHIKSDIKISSISPGAVDTDMIPKEVEMPKLSVEDIVDATIYCLSTNPNVQVPELTIKPTHDPY